MADEEKAVSGNVAGNAAVSQSDVKGVDVALALVGERAQEYDLEMERRVVRKIDWFLIPAMIVGYGLVDYDKAILGSAVLFGMTSDLALSVPDRTTPPPPPPPTTDTSRLSWATSLFYFGMLAGLYPMTFALQRFNLGRILGGVVIAWGGVCMLTAAVTTWRGLYAQRFFLGFVESVVPTGFMRIVSGYYTQREQALRQSLWFASTGIFTIVGTALNYGFAQIEGGKLRTWQYIYLLAGALTVGFGGWCFAVPNSPVDAWFLTVEERVVAVERLRRGQTGVRCQQIKGDQVVAALLDVKLWLISLMMASAYTVNGAVSGFGPLIVSTFGYTSLQSILLQFPLGLLCLISILVSGYLSTRFKNVLIPLLLLNTLPVIAGFAIIWRSSWTPPRPTGPVVGYTLIGTFGGVVSLTIVLEMANVAGATKKSVMAGAIFVAYCVGNIVGPQLIKSETRAQHYPQLWTGLIICYCITIIAAVALWVILWRENKRRDDRAQSSRSESFVGREARQACVSGFDRQEKPFFPVLSVKRAEDGIDRQKSYPVFVQSAMSTGAGLLPFAAVLSLTSRRVSSCLDSTLFRKSIRPRYPSLDLPYSSSSSAIPSLST